MKAIEIISKSLLFGFILMFSASLYAQDSTDATSGVTMKTILDNEKVKVFQVEYAPGQSTPMSYYPEHVAYVVSGGKMEITEKGKEAKVMDINEGEAMYMAASTDMLKNVGTTTVKVVVTVLKTVKKGVKEETTMDNQKDSKTW